MFKFFILCIYCDVSILFPVVLFCSFRVPTPTPLLSALERFLMAAQRGISVRITPTCTSTWWSTISPGWTTRWSAWRLGMYSTPALNVFILSVWAEWVKEWMSRCICWHIIVSCWPCFFSSIVILKRGSSLKNYDFVTIYSFLCCSIFMYGFLSYLERKQYAKTKQYPDHTPATKCH